MKINNNNNRILLNNYINNYISENKLNRAEIGKHKHFIIKHGGMDVVLNYRYFYTGAYIEFILDGEYHKLQLQFQNGKLIGDEKTEFIIFSTVPASCSIPEFCPGSTELCREGCYCVNAWRRFKKYRDMRVLNSRFMMLPASLIIRIYTEFIFLILSENKFENEGKRILFRVHESGELIDAEYSRVIYNIIKNFEELNFLNFSLYTKNYEAIKNEEYNLLNLNNLNLKFSIFPDSNIPENEPENINKYITITEEYKTEKSIDENLICTGECNRCMNCYSRGIKNSRKYVILHGNISNKLKNKINNKLNNN